VITQRIMGLDLLKQLKIHNVVALDFLLSDFRQDFCFAVQKGNDVLLRKLNEGLSVVIANNTFNTIRNQWFGPDQTNVISLRKTLMIALYIIIPLFIIYAIVIMLFLRKEVRKRTRDLKNEINEHKKTLTSLQQRNIMLNEMEKVSLIGAWEYDIKTKEITWTSGVYDIFGVDAETFDPSHYELDIAFYHERDQEVLNQAFQKLIETGTPYDLELELSAASGESKWVRTRGRAEHRNGKIIRIYGDIQDVTIIKKINDELKESVQQLRLLMNSTGEGIIGVDKDGICTFCNMSALKTLNYHAKTDVIGKNMHQLIHYAYEDGSRHPIEKSIIHQVLRTGQGTRTDEDILWRSDGSCFYAEIFSYPIMENDDIKGAVVTFFDISKRKKAQDELNELKNNLEKQIKERTRELNKKVNTLDKSQKAMLYMIEDLNDITAELKSKREELESAKNLKLLHIPFPTIFVLHFAPLTDSQNSFMKIMQIRSTMKANA
jgi:PAS domain S-box-containing protein